MKRLALTELTLSHFRSHRQAHITCDGRPIAIFGANGAGKTNLLEAVSLLSPGRGMRRASPDDLTRRPEALGWKVKGVLQSLHQMHELETGAEAGQSRNVRIDGRSVVELHPENAAKIRRIFELYGYHSHTLDTLPDALLAEGFQYLPSTPKVGRSKLYAILTDRSYIGEIKFCGQ